MESMNETANIFNPHLSGKVRQHPPALLHLATEHLHWTIWDLVALVLLLFFFFFFCWD